MSMKRATFGAGLCVAASLASSGFIAAPLPPRCDADNGGITLGEIRRQINDNPAYEFHEFVCGVAVLFPTHGVSVVKSGFLVVEPTALADVAA